MSNYLTEVRLLHVPLENDYKHTLYFSDTTAQANYFISTTATSNGVPLVQTECSYQRKDNIIKYPACVDDIRHCNYVMYKNKSHSSKWFYAFINRMDYKNDELTEIYIETDVMQTWLRNEDYTIKDSFVEREHAESDLIGEHTTPEQLEVGEFVCNGVSIDNNLKDYVYMIQCTETTNGDALYATNYGGVWQAGGAYVCEGVNVHDIVQVFANNGKKDAVTNVYLIPKKIVNNSNTEDMKYSGQASPTVYTHTFAKQKEIDGYTPRNKKLLCFPFNFLTLSNNAGTSNILHYEHFAGDNCTFEIEGVPVVGGSIKCVPLNYKGVDRMHEEGIMLGKFPACSWSEDIYTNWLTQNAVNLGIGLASQGLQIVGGAGLLLNPVTAPAGASTMTSGALGVAQTLGQVYQMSFTPNSAQGNTNGGDINTSNKMNTFYFYKMSIKKEYARIIDDYFSMYGYKICRVKKPAFAHRENYWHIKTRDINLDGAIPTEDIQKLKMIYDNGVTFWSNPANIGNYRTTSGDWLSNNVKG